MKFSEGGLAGEGEIADSKLFDLVIAADEEALSEGLSPEQRAMATVSKIMKQLGYASFAMAGAATPAIVQRIQAIHRSLYRGSDLAVGGIHGGIFMFRDVFARIECERDSSSSRESRIGSGRGRLRRDHLTTTARLPISFPAAKSRRCSRMR